MQLLQEIEEILAGIPADAGGGSTLEKCLVMCRAAELFQCRTYVEIGVYRGRSFFPMATTMRRLGGRSYGVDPYSREAAQELEVSPHIRACLDEWLATSDFDALHEEVVARLDRLGLAGSATILRDTSAGASSKFIELNFSIDMLHVDGNHDTRQVMDDLERYLPLLNAGGVLVLDDVDWPSVAPAHALARSQLLPLFEAETFALLAKKGGTTPLRAAGQELFLIYEAAASRAWRRELKKSQHLTNQWILAIGESLTTTQQIVHQLQLAEEKRRGIPDPTLPAAFPTLPSETAASPAR